jgi:hypothetical protein
MHCFEFRIGLEGEAASLAAQEEQKNRRAEEQKSRRAEEQKNRRAEEQLAVMKKFSRN